MGKRFVSINYTLIIRNAAGDHLNGTVSPHDIAKTRKFAQSLLRLLPEAASVDIHVFDPASSAAQSQPIESVNWDQDWEEA